MIDKTNPTNQFHRYVPSSAIPHSEEMPSSGLRSVLGKAGLDLDSFTGLGDKLMNNVDMRQSVEKARAYARSNPAVVLGGLAAAAIGAGLLRKLNS